MTKCIKIIHVMWCEVYSVISWVGFYSSCRWNAFGNSKLRPVSYAMHACNCVHWTSAHSERLIYNHYDFQRAPCQICLPWGVGSSSTLLYPVSLLRLGTGWEPPIRGSEMFERFPRPNLTDFFHFFCKKHMAYPFPNITFFLGVHKFFFPPQNWPFFLGTTTFPKLRAHFQNWGSGLWENLGLCCC